MEYTGPCYLPAEVLSATGLKKQVVSHNAIIIRLVI